LAAKQLKNFVQHVLTVQPLVGDTVLTFDSVSGWPTVGDFFLRLDNVALTISELVKVTSVNVGANQVTVVRAQEGTSASGSFVVNSTGGNDLTAQTLTDAMVRLDTSLSQDLTGPLRVPVALGGAYAATSYGSMPVKLAETILGGNAATVVFSSIPATGRDLELGWYARCDLAAAVVEIDLRYNNISTATYDFQTFYWNGATSVFADTLGVTRQQIGWIPAANDTANYFGQGRADINNYAGTTGHKLVSSRGAWSESDLTSAACRSFAYNGKWRTVATAINELDLAPNLFANNFIAGSLFVLWMKP
jgi:hypothetical protein